MDDGVGVDDDDGAGGNMTEGKCMFHWCKQILWWHHKPKIRALVGTDRHVT